MSSSAVLKGPDTRPAAMSRRPACMPRGSFLKAALVVSMRLAMGACGRALLICRISASSFNTRFSSIAVVICGTLYHDYLHNCCAYQVCTRAIMFTLASPIVHTKEKCPTPSVGHFGGLTLPAWIGDRSVINELHLLRVLRIVLLTHLGVALWLVCFCESASFGVCSDSRRIYS